MTFGWDPTDCGSTEADSIAIFNRALELGVNFIDTANVYARGVSETILGKAMAGKRDGLVIATKCHGKMDDTDPNAWGNTRRNIIQACEASLKRLGTDWIDLYQIHRPQPSVPIDETLRALDDLIRSGKVRYAGCSTFAAWQVCEAHYVAKQLGINGFVCEQPPYNLLDRRIERELLPFCRTYNYGVIPWSPLAGGQLSGKYITGAASNTRYSNSDPMGRLHQKSKDVTAKLKRIADAYHMSLTTMSIAWVAGQPGITSPIVGARNVEQLEESVAACLVKLPAKCLDRINAVIAPGTHVSEYYNANFGPNERPN